MAGGRPQGPPVLRRPICSTYLRRGLPIVPVTLPAPTPYITLILAFESDEPECLHLCRRHREMGSASGRSQQAVQSGPG